MGLGVIKPIILINEYKLNGTDDYILNVSGARELNCGLIL